MCKVLDCKVEGDHGGETLHMSARGGLYPINSVGMRQLIDDYERDKAEFRHVADGFVERIRNLVDQTTRNN